MTRTPRISKAKQNILMRCFASDLVAYCDCEFGDRCAARRAKVSPNTANHYYRHFRELIYVSLRRAPRFLGTVEMDQKEFGGRGSKRMKQYLKRIKKTLPYDQYMEKARQARAEHKIKVFGILQREGDVYVHIIKKEDARTLIPIVRLVVEQGAIVYTDRWRGFSGLGMDGYTHASVDHSVEYKNRAGVHINGIESFWSFAQRRLLKFNGLHASTFPLHLKECEWRYNTKDIGAALKALLPQNPPRTGTAARSPKPTRRTARIRTRHSPRRRPDPALS